MATEAKIKPETETKEELNAYYVEKSIRNEEVADYLIVLLGFCIALGFLSLGFVLWKEEGFVYGILSIPFFFSGLFLIRNIIIAVKRLP
jgi:hypothetical protein